MKTSPSWRGQAGKHLHLLLRSRRCMAGKSSHPMVPVIGLGGGIKGLGGLYAGGGGTKQEKMNRRKMIENKGVLILLNRLHEILV